MEVRLLSISRLNNWRCSYKKYGYLYISYGSSATETPGFSVCIWVSVPWMCVCICVLSSPAFVCVCVWVCVQNTANKEIKVTGHETWSNQKRRNETPIDYGRLVHVFQQGPCLGQEWRNNSQWQIRTPGPLIWKYSKRHKQAHDFCCVVVCVCTRKQGWRFEESP